MSLAFAAQTLRATSGDLYASGDLGGDETKGIYRFDPSGSRNTFTVTVNGPEGIAFDRAGNLFVGDTGPCMGIDPIQCQPSTILKFTPSGERTTFASGGLHDPVSLAFDGAGNLFVADIDAIYKFTPDGIQSTFVSDQRGFTGLAFDSLGNLYATQSRTGLILKFTPQGERTVYANVSGSPWAPAFDKLENLFFIDDSTSNGAIIKIGKDGTRSIFASGVYGYSLAFDDRGYLYAADNTTSTIYKFTPAGDKSSLASFFGFGLAFEPVIEKVRNLSARGLVGTGDNALIGGFILGGSALDNNAVVVRAIGPSLAQFGVANPLQDPILELYNSNGVLITRNDNWQDTQPLQITASGLAPSDAREAAIYATLPAGNFTAVVHGAGNSTGVALVEVYSK